MNEPANPAIAMSPTWPAVRPRRAGASAPIAWASIAVAPATRTPIAPPFNNPTRISCVRPGREASSARRGRKAPTVTASACWPAFPAESSHYGHGHRQQRGCGNLTPEPPDHEGGEARRHRIKQEPRKSGAEPPRASYRVVPRPPTHPRRGGGLLLVSASMTSITSSNVTRPSRTPSAETTGMDARL